MTSPKFRAVLAALHGFLVPVSAAVVDLTFNSPSDVPISAAAYTATGNTLNVSLNFVPAPGTSLTVVKNTGQAFIEGSFGNLVQGQGVNLSYAGTTYPFVANYFGGTGNDLVLQWAITRLCAWGSNENGQLGAGNSSVTPATLLQPVVMTGVLAGKMVVAVAGGGTERSLALCADGTVAAWGNNAHGQLGNNSTTHSTVPVLVDTTGVLAGKTVIAIAASESHSLALCSDGTLASWGLNSYGQLGNNSTNESTVPVLVDRTGVLAGKSIIAVAAGGRGHNLALCSDGTLASWGVNDYGQLGNTTSLNSSVPVLVWKSGILVSKRVIALAAGRNHSLVLCLDGTLAAWGDNFYGQLGNGGIINHSLAPLKVLSSGVLLGKTPVLLSAGDAHNMTWCSNGALAAWGSNGFGQLGNNSGSDSKTPDLVVMSGALVGKTVTAIAAGSMHSLALCSDGTLAAWGDNSSGQLGIGQITPRSLLPVLTNTAGLGTGERIVAINCGSKHSLAVVASPLLPVPATLEATVVSDSGAILNASVNAQGNATSMSFQYGLTDSYGSSIAATPTTVSGTTTSAVSAMLGGLLSGTTYHYRVVANCLGGTVNGADMTFTTSTFASLSGLTLSNLTLTPGFTSSNTTYLTTAPFATTSTVVTALTTYPDATLRVNGLAVASGTVGDPIPLAVGNTTLTLQVAAADGIHTNTYTVTVTRLPEVFAFNSATDVPVAVNDLVASGNTVHFALNFAPVPGCTLTAVRIIGTGAFRGTFDNLAQGQLVRLTYGGITYPFVANYFGGTGNDLILQWANTRVLMWGRNDPFSALVPVGVDLTGVLANKTIIALADGSDHDLALCSDGTLAAWGTNVGGRLGNGSTTSSNVPVLVDATGVLAGKRVIAVDAGGGHNLALCSDGTLAAWGYNNAGELGNNSLTASSVPVLVNRTGVLAGKTVVSIAAGESHSLALCSDGTLAAWGANYKGQLGNDSILSSSEPVVINTFGVLAGRVVRAIVAGERNSMAVCADGTIATWGANNEGQLGNTSYVDSSVPVAVDRTGVLSGRTIAGGAEQASTMLAWCTDGTLISWGAGSHGALGNNTYSRSSVPVLVDSSGVLADKIVVAAASGWAHGLGLCSDGTLAAWGRNFEGQLGNNSTSESHLPVLVDTSGLISGERFMAVGGGETTSLALTAMLPPPLVTTMAASAIRDDRVTLNADVQANGSLTAVTFEYGLTTAYGTTIVGSPSPLAGTGTTAVSASPSGLLSGTIYHYRVIVTSAAGSATGDDLTFTTTDAATLTSISPNAGLLSPSFESRVTRYIVTVPFATAAISLTPATTYDSATVTVNSSAVTSGTPSAPVPLVVGPNLIEVVVRSGDGLNVTTYQITVTRLPEVLTLAAPDAAPVTADDFTATGVTVSLELGFTPRIGARLTVVDNTGSGAICGTFDNLAQAQKITLSHGGISYPYIVNYSGGTGNDLVLEWGNTRVFDWGRNESGQLGNGSTTSSLIPIPVDPSGALAGKTVRSVAGGNTYSLALFWDGTMATWGDNVLRPMTLGLPGSLAGKRVSMISAGGDHRLALCTDGTVASWGNNSYGQLGRPAGLEMLPGLVPAAGALAGKMVIAVAAGAVHSLALCNDGSVAAWGANFSGQLGNNSNTDSRVPVAVDTTGILAGKKVVAIAAGGNQSLALCADGTLVSWGSNTYGQLGNNDSGTSRVPVAVVTTGVLAGKRITSMAVGAAHSLVLCADGSLASWGSNVWGALGDGTTTGSRVPVLVDRTGVLSGKTVTGIGAGYSVSVAVCADGSMASWGDNLSGLLGNNSTTSSSTPVLVNSSMLPAGEGFIAGDACAPGRDHPLGIVAAHPPPIATTMAATAVTDTGATFHASVQPNGSDTMVSFAYGLTANYGNTVSAIPSQVTGSGQFAASAVIGGLLSGTTYHFRVVTTNQGGTFMGEDQTFITGDLTALARLVPDVGMLDPEFSLSTRAYAITVPPGTSSITLTPTVNHDGATVAVNQVAVTSGTPSGAIPLAVGNTTISVDVTAAGGGITGTYTITVTRPPAEFLFDSAATIPVTASRFTADGLTASVALGFPPVAGTELTMVRCVDRLPIRGVFVNLAQGQMVPLTHAGTTYSFVADYHGGTGNDLVLRWANTRVMAWGANAYGQLGNNTTTNNKVAGPVNMTGVLAGKSVIALGTGDSHALALCSDGTLAAWGYNNYGQCGNNSTSTNKVPVLVDQTGVLMGKTVIAISAGGSHNLALCADGTLASWGYNSTGQLGNGGTTQSNVPVLVDRSGVLLGKTVIAIAAGGSHSLALCSDGTVAAWGSNNYNQLGRPAISGSYLPIWVDRTSALADKTVIAIAAGTYNSQALCSDGSLTAWGNNANGGLGNNSTVKSSVPVVVNTAGELADKTLASFTVGSYHNLVRCTDDSLAAWGGNPYGQLGNNSTTSASLPVRVDQMGVLFGKSIVAIASGYSHSMALCADGSLATWGNNASGQLGDNSTTQRLKPVLASMASLRSGERLIMGVTGQAAYYSLGLAASPLQSATPLPASALTGTSARLNGRVNANGNAITVALEYGLSPAYGNTVAATPAAISGGSDTAVWADISGLAPETIYHFRVLASGYGGIVRSADMTFTTISNDALLSSLAMNVGTLFPAFSRNVTSYLATVSNATSAVTVTPVTNHPLAVVTVNGVPLASGAASAPISLAVGATEITTTVMAEDGVTTKSYAITVNRLLPELGDLDHDGVSNLLEQAFGLNPTAGSVDALPQPVIIGERLETRFTQPAGISGLTYGAQWSTTLLPGSWTDVPDTGSGNEHLFSVPRMNSPSLYLRLSVTAP